MDKLCCFKCGSTSSLLVQETIDKNTYKVIEKNFICLECAGGPEKLFNKDS